MKFLALLFPVIFLFSCSSNRNTSTVKNIDKITYAFRDASVPPQYHRSYTLTVSTTGAKIVVDSYGDVLAEKDYHIIAEGWDKLVALTQQLQAGGSYTAEGATGTKGHGLKLYEGGKEVYSLYWDSLSEKMIKKPALNLRDEMKAVFPDLSELRK